MKKVPNLRFKEFSGEWESNKIEKICDTITDYVAAGSFENIRNSVTYYNSENFAQLVRTIDLKSNFNNKDFIFVDEKAYNFLYRVNLNEDSIILPNIGVNIGESYYVEPEKLPSENNVLGPNAILLRSEINNTKYIYYLFNTKAFHKQLVQIIGASGQPKFNKTELKQMKFYVPTIEEQEKIAAFFSLIDKKIELQIEKLEELKKYKKGLMQKIFSQQLRFKDENGNEYPEWDRFSIGELAEVTAGRKKDAGQGEYIIMDMGSITPEGKILTHKRSSDCIDLLKKGDLVMPKDDIGGGLIIGKTAYIPTDNKYILGDHVYRIRFKNSNSLFMHYQINSYGINKQLKSKVTGSAQLGINSKSVVEQILFVPSIEEQNKIGILFLSLDSKIEIEEEKRSVIQEYKKGLLQQMFI